MCGICGKYSSTGVHPGEIKSMMQTIAHRGPDDEGVYINGHFGMGSSRLSIIDLPGGHQPIPNEDGTVWIVFNGEIYNYKSLRRELEKKGHHFRTNSDTEVVVHLYEDLDVHCVDNLNGMFAFAIWDEKKQKLVLARDRLGQKPLFYSQEGENLLFASEVKAILSISNLRREIDYESLHHYLSLRFIPSPQTMLCQIMKLPPAHVLVFQAGKTTCFRYWDLTYLEKHDVSEEELLVDLRDRISRSVHSHLVSDVPVGAYLSGGLDSSTIVAVMARNLEQPFKTFTVGVQEDDFNETPYARMVADQYHTEHIENQVDANLIYRLPRMIWYLDEPSDPVAACMYFAAELASRHVKVVLGGDGGDELFAGFDRYLSFGYINAYSTIPYFVRQSILEPMIDRIRDGFAYKNFTQKARWAHYLSQFKSPGERYAEATCFFRFGHRDKQELYADGLWDRLGHLNSAEIITEQYEQAHADDPIDRMLYTDFVTRLPEHSLMLTDRMSMAHGLEVRSPYLDHELVEYMAAIPSHMKIRERTTKHLLRKAASEYLPDKIVGRRKQGFMLPIAYWLREPLYPIVKPFLLKSQLVQMGVIRKESVLRMIEEHRNNRVDHHVRLWMLLNLEIWHQLYIEQIDLPMVENRLRQASQV